MRSGLLCVVLNHQNVEKDRRPTSEGEQKSGVVSAQGGVRSGYMLFSAALSACELPTCDEIIRILAGE